jgi:asparagine synthase (glutamine-hydrolysing)
MKGRQTKYLLRKVAEKYLPHDVVYRPKAGFGAPIENWVRHDLDEYIAHNLSEDAITAAGIFDFKEVDYDKTEWDNIPSIIPRYCIALTK